ncbi:alpha-mannosidase [Clostridium sp. CF011]|uniref:glycoside hydrolase family 38 N-terminal domain-containing protein n=1 Tax=unclassified Clostridium TaxID=2614128 RepID=UPI001C0E8000|nr:MULTISPECIES: glycoside hydrolase family 38 C-terminal domain-containing protein [unclassified Clostridium]MBU3092525.1 alpha-mannosidase [Clostridium sp. CF011]MBW9146358.1 alpha-mannosidase [Clostridium sp. CM027]UVE39870.1 alpha-mannosidase [Clostridium sp. CM027]WAG68786.1 alpha-mannosidase [Clostridium sp. CF011]
MNKKKKVYIVPHSHWDREWYFTIEDSNVLLSQNIPYLIEVLEKDSEFNSYTLDAQLSIVEEYLVLYPEDRVKLEELIKERRIFVGPWYTQTDTLLVNKESIIRNLLYGTRLGNKFGHSMTVGYLPDVFGQNQYLPSIFRGFDIEDSILQRGVYTEDLKDNLNFRWSSPDGERVKANNIFLGYGPGKFLTTDDKYIEEKLIPMLEKLESLNVGSDDLLLPAGGDQVLVRNHFPKTIKELNEKQYKYEFILSNYEDFMKDTMNKSFENEIKGELIACQKSRIHNTIKSQRYDIKKANYDVENKILYILEPLAVIGNSLGLKYPTPWVDIMWKSLFDVHAHDSIGGCNSDATNRGILNRIEKSDRICSGLINVIKKQITTAISKKVRNENIVVLFNTKVYSSVENVETVIFSVKKNFNLNTIEGNSAEFDIVKRDYISGGKQVVASADGDTQIELPGYYRSEVIIKNEELKALGYKTLIVNEGEINSENILEVIEDHEIENNFYKIRLKDNEITLINKKTSEEVTDIFYFEDSEDCGDSYDYSPSSNGERTVISKAILLEVKKSKNINKMIIQHRGVNYKSCEIIVNTEIELRNGESTIRIKHHIDNTAKDHRVRVVLNTNVVSSTSLSDQGFSFIERSNTNKYLKNWRESGFVEAPVPIYALENMVMLKDEKYTYGVITKGIKEYEILENSKIALTLFRSVGLLGRDDLLWRPGRASGINNKVVYTPDAQMIKKMNFEYAITLRDSSEELFKQVDKFIGRYTSYQKQNLNLFEERVERFEIPLNLDVNGDEYSLMKIDNANIIQSVCKESYEKDGFIVRLFNPGYSEEVVNLYCDKFKSIKLTNLYEKEIEEVNGEIKVKPRGYVTIKIIV